MSDDKNLTPANSAAPPLPAAQDAGQIPVKPGDLQTGPPRVAPPLTSATGTGFNAPDAGIGLPEQPIDPMVGNPGPMAITRPSEMPAVDRDALAGENAGAGSQADAEAINSTSTHSDQDRDVVREPAADRF